MALLQTLSQLHCCADRAVPARDIDDGCLHKSAHSTGVSLDEASACWSFIPCELPIHFTAMVHGVSSLMPTSVQIWCSLIGAERPKTWGGSSQKLGRIDRVWGGSTRGGSTLGRIVCKPVFLGCLWYRGSCVFCCSYSVLSVTGIKSRSRALLLSRSQENLAMS